MNSDDVKKIKEQYPEGTRIYLDEDMDDPQGVPAGTCGTVTGVDDIGNIAMAWDIGSSLNLLPDIDHFHIIT